MDGFICLVGVYRKSLVAAYSEKGRKTLIGSSNASNTVTYIYFLFFIIEGSGFDVFKGTAARFRVFRISTKGQY